MIKLVLSAIAALWLFCLQAIAAPADTTARFDPETGLFVLRHHTVEVAKANFVFWAGKWEWRGLTLATETRAPFDYGLTGTNKDDGAGGEGLCPAKCCQPHGVAHARGAGFRDLWRPRPSSLILPPLRGKRLCRSSTCFRAGMAGRSNLRQTRSR